MDCAPRIRDLCVSQPVKITWQLIDAGTGDNIATYAARDGRHRA